MKLTIAKTGEPYEEITHTSDAKLKEGMTQIKFFKNESNKKNAIRQKNRLRHSPKSTAQSI